MIFKLLVVTTLILAGCAPKSTPVPTEFVISSMVQALATSSNGGLYFAGRSSTGEEFSLGLANSGNLNLVLNQGQWTFYTIAWEGPEPMTGEHRCDITQATLAPGNQTVSIELAKAKCIDGRFGRVDANPALSAYMPSGTGQTFKRLNLNPCLDVSQVSAQGQNCRGLADTTYSHHMKGENLSFRVSLRSKALPGMEPRRLMSSCITSPLPGDYSHTFYTTNLRLPIGGSFQGLLYDIHGYEDQNCTDLEAVYRLPPVTRQASGYVYRLPPSNVTTTENTLYFTDNFIGTGVPILGNKKAVIGCGPSGNEHCFPYFPEAMGNEGSDFNDLARTLETLLSNAPERESHTYGAKASLHLFNGIDLLIQSTQAGSLFNSYILDVMANPMGANPVEVSVDAPNKRIIFMINPDHGICSDPGYTNEIDCTTNLQTWNPTAFTNDMVRIMLNTQLSSSMPELIASTNLPGNNIDADLIAPGFYNFTGGRNPDLNSGRMSSVVSEIANFTAGPYMSALASEGITTCAAIPTSGAIERTFLGVENHFVRLEFSVGSAAIPTWLNGGTSFEKRIRFISDDGETAILEFNCDAFAEGYLHLVEPGNIKKIFWKTDSPLTAQIEVYSFHSEPPNNHYEVTRFKKIDIETFEVVTSKASTGHNILMKVRGNKDDLWINSTLGMGGAIALDDVADFETYNTGSCFSSAGTSSANCSPIMTNVSLIPNPFIHNSWSTFATQNWNNPQFFDCPRGYIQVAGNSTFVTTDFCVMKYEARDVAGFPRSQPNNIPWTSVDRLGADAACGSLGGAYTLMTNPQWMTLAQAIELDPANWNSGSVGGGSLFVGHSINTPATVCDSTYESIGASCTTPNMGPSNRRTHYVGGQQIWDISGNAKEWIDWDVLQVDKAYANSDGFPVTAVRSIDLIDMKIAFGEVMFSEDWKPFNAGLTSTTNGIGKYTSGTAGGAAIRGGAYLSADAGIYSLDLSKTEVTVHAAIGFRCVYNP